MPTARSGKLVPGPQGTHLVGFAPEVLGMRGMLTMLGAVAVVPLMIVACGGDSDDDGSGGSGGSLLGGAAGMSGSGGGGTGGTAGGSGGTAGGSGGSGGVINNECSPIPSKTPATDGGASDAGGTDASADAGSSDASTSDAAVTDAGPGPDSGAGDSGTGGAPGDGGAPTIQCGAQSCTGLSIAGNVINPCCTVDGCGMDLPQSVAGLIGMAPGCYGVGQAGGADATCPMFSVANPLGGGNIDFPGCCQPDGECGFVIDTSGFGGPNLGCVSQECNGGPAKTCTP